MLRLVLSLFILSSFVFVGAVNAQGTPSHKRGMHAHKRVEQGIKSGELTKDEAMQLKAEHEHIKEMKHKAKADGVVTPEEKAAIKDARKKASENIYKEKHDDEKVEK